MGIHIAHNMGLTQMKHNQLLRESSSSWANRRQIYIERDVRVSYFKPEIPDSSPVQEAVTQEHREARKDAEVVRPRHGADMVNPQNRTCCSFILRAMIAMSVCMNAHAYGI